ncbi:Ribosome LSU-associated GTP-binding protein HflX [hydrothermal vent metagenome]|uniref:Ribosome LSU-associated GTP-binding protein HflX n=1 Tax=hydrothermal vent metagenome TaxID=652676 RepID=A0A3B1A3Z8_9ZZZZ
MFERPKSGERAVIVHIEYYGSTVEDSLAEFKELARSAGAEVLEILTGSRTAPDPRHFIGKGKIAELKILVQSLDAEIVLFNHELSPAQERNIEASIECRVLDRTGLILDIFAQRARTHDGKLQVELAQLSHLATRLVRGWTHLERQKGGIGLRGPGETQLETDRRLLNERIKQLNKRLKRVQSQREQGRRSRKRADIATVSLVGYTNAGKSTLFNILTESEVYAEDQLFATLDPTLRRLELPDGDAVILVDTVGFIRELPHDLVAAFRSTLQETCEADLLLHVIDASSPIREQNINEVNKVLKEIKADAVNTIEVYNKVDRIQSNNKARVDRDGAGNITRIWVSALTGDGLVELQQLLKEVLAEDTIKHQILLGPAEGRLRASIFAMGSVQNEQITDDGSTVMDITLKRKDWFALCKKEQIEQKIVDPVDRQLAVEAKDP